MIGDKRILAVVPARGGSKGVPLKNIHPLHGKPLIAHTAELIAGLLWIDRAVVSTDHERIAEVAESHGLPAPFRRPAPLSGDRIGDVPVLAHALEAMEARDDVTYDVVVMLQPTSPLRRASDVEATVRKLVQEGRDAVWTVSPTDLKYHPRKQLTLEGGRLAFHDPEGAQVIARQQLTPLYHRNGAAYAIARETLLSGDLMGANSGAVVIEDATMISIDTPGDFAAVADILAAREVAPKPGARSLVVDIDGVLATIVPGNDYTLSQPLHENIARVNALFDAGHHIVLFTARGSKTGIDWRSTTEAQMAGWGVRYHELRLGKPAADHYVDDRMTTLARVLADLGLDPKGENA